MSRVTKVGDRFVGWTLRHKWEWRIAFTTLYAWLIYDNFRGDVGYWEIALGSVEICVLAGMCWMWWRQDALDEFDRRTREAIGSDANIVIFMARMKLRTRSIVKLNRVMRRYDVMNTPILDLPPEAKELRAILESVRTT